MKFILCLAILSFSINGLLFSQTVRDLDNPTAQSQNTAVKSNLLKTQTQPATTSVDITTQEVEAINELASTIEAVIFEEGNETNIAQERGVPCLKADTDISTFLQFTRSDSDKKRMIATCQEVQLVRFSFRDSKDFDMAQSIDFTLLNQFPQLKYIVFYVAPSVYKQSTISQQKTQVQAKLENLINDKISSPSVKIFYRIPQGG